MARAGVNVRYVKDSLDQIVVNITLLMKYKFDMYDDLIGYGSFLTVHLNTQKYKYTSAISFGYENG